MPDRTDNDLTCLWMDLKTSVQIAEVPAAFARHCTVHQTSGFDELGLERVQPDFVVLEFDYPSRQDLARAVVFKRDFASMPMVAVSVQHSESLALWFFRARFYDFLVQPLAAVEVNNCLSELKEVKRLKGGQQSRKAARANLELPNEASSSKSPHTRLQPAITLVERNYHQRLMVTEAAEQCGIPPFRFGREFKEQYGMDFREFVLRYRVKEACRMLQNPKASVTEIGYSVGFSEPSYFTKMFKKLVGRCPSEVLGDPDLSRAADLRLQMPLPKAS